MAAVHKEIRTLAQAAVADIPCQHGQLLSAADIGRIAVGLDLDLLIGEGNVFIRNYPHERKHEQRGQNYEHAARYLPELFHLPLLLYCW